MKASRRPIIQRPVAALHTLRGRPAKPDYGILIVFPFLAAAGGVLLALAIELAMDRHRTSRSPRYERPTKAYSATDAEATRHNTPESSAAGEARTAAGTKA